MKALKRIADQIARGLIAEGFTVHRYDAQSTSSIYLKIDWGACNMIRISDHPGHAHGSARYNIGTWIAMDAEIEDTYPRFYFEADHANGLIERCVADRDMRIGICGRAGYAQSAERKRKEAKRARAGFWTKARRVR